MAANVGDVPGLTTARDALAREMRAIGVDFWELDEDLVENLAGLDLEDQLEILLDLRDEQTSSRGRR